MSLSDALKLAKVQSLDQKIAYNISQSAYWIYQSYKAGFLPKLSLSGNLPDYYRSINPITLPDGQNQFIGQNVSNASLYLNLTQNIPATGGTLSIGSSLLRIDNFGNFRNTNYTAVPITLNYNQQNLFYNDFKWQRKIQPLKLKEEQRGYLENMENISITTVNYYFTMLMANIQLSLDQQNLKNIDTLVKITKARFEIGTVQLNDVLQSEVSLLKAKRSLYNSTLGLSSATQNLIRYLDLAKGDSLELILPDTLSFFDISKDLALAKAKQNRKFVIEFQRRRLEAEQNEHRTRAESSPVINLRLNIGFTQTGNDLGKSYNDLLRNQALTASIYVPILDWGVNRSNKRRAEANIQLENNNIAQQELLIEQEIDYQIGRWNTQKAQMKIAVETKELSLKRYGIAKQKYALGTLSFTDFNNAQLDKDRAMTDYISMLQNYWSLYFLIRRLTLYDFEKQKNIVILQSTVN